ncbi:MAG: GNAT family N-acetyltransferase [Eubacteriales bacterium]|nr:GNAT family N-acetyltransferase [Eubacteriales bacterium]
MEMRHAKKEDLKELKEIWKLAFGDEDRFINLYFQSRDWSSETAVLLVDGRIVSMQTVIPVHLIGEDGGKSSAAMLYAVATHPDFQKRGFADQLIGFSNQTLLSEGISITVLVPATEELFRFYGKRGYHKGFYIREAVLSRADIEALAGRDSSCCRISSIEAAEYNLLRKRLLRGQPYLDYREEELSFQKKLARMSGADLYVLELGGTEGCAYAERISQEEVIVKELLLPEHSLSAAVCRISALLPAEKYTVRTPPHCGEALGGMVRPFGMLRMNSRNDCPSGLQSYLGIAYD